MANKFRPGIPDGYNLDVKPVSDLGDYLDEPPPRPRPPTPTREALEAARAEPAAAEVRVELGEARAAIPQRRALTRSVDAPALPAASRSASVLATRPQPGTPPRPSEPAREPSGPAPKGPRREINMTPETIKMSDELLEMFRGGSGQRDTKASEVFHALVLLAFEAKDEIDLHGIPKRGRWGSPTARAYPLELKNALLRAIIRKYASEDFAETAA